MIPSKERVEGEVPLQGMREPASPINVAPVPHVAKGAGISVRVIAFFCREYEWGPGEVREILGKLCGDLCPDG